MDFNTFKTIAAAEASACGIQDYELYYSAEQSTEVRVFNGEVDKFTSGLSGGICFRCIADGHSGSASTQAMSETAARELVRAAFENARCLEKDSPALFAPGGSEYAAHKEADMPFLGAEALIRNAKKANDALLSSHPSVTDRCNAMAYSVESELHLVNSNGVDLSCRDTIDVTVLAAVVSDGKENNNEYKLCCEDPEKLDLNALAKETSERAASMLGAGPAPTGSWPIVFSSDAMSSLLQTFSGAFSAENARKGLSALAGKEGEVAASELVTIMDDPFYEKNPVHRSFDGEGSPTFTKAVIKNGELKTLLYDLSSAAAQGKTTTGNACRRSYSSPVGISPFTMYIAGGSDTEETLFEKAGDGIYITGLGGLHAGANPINGDFSLQSSGFMIEKGKKTIPVRSFTISGNFFDMLKHVIGLSREVKLSNASSPTAFGSPAVLIDRLSAAGK